MSDSWKVEFFVDKATGTKPALEFFRTLTEQERERFSTRIGYVVQEGLGILAKRNDVLETLGGSEAEGLYSLRLVKGNNVRFLICAVRDRRLVILHGFYEANARDYRPAIALAQRRRQDLLKAEAQLQAQQERETKQQRKRK